MSADPSLPRFHPSFDVNKVLPAVLVAGTQVIFSVIGAMLLSSGALA